MDRKLKGLKAFMVNSPSEFIERYNMVKTLGLSNNIMVQEVVEGRQRRFTYSPLTSIKIPSRWGYLREGKLRQYPPDFGNTTLAEGFACEEISSKAIDILTKMKYHGLCDVEFKRDRKDNKLRS